MGASANHAATGLAALPATGIFGQSLADTPMGWIRAPVSRNRLIALRSVSCRVILGPRSLTRLARVEVDRVGESIGEAIAEHGVRQGLSVVDHAPILRPRHQPASLNMARWTTRRWWTRAEP